jgi:hypothetical protein
MKERLLDIAVAVIILLAGIVLLAIEQYDQGSIAVSASLGYLIGAIREKPGGLDEAVMLGNAEVEYIGEDNAEV